MAQVFLAAIGFGDSRLAIALSVAAIVVALLSAWYARGQLHEARRASAMPLVIDMFREFREMRGARLRVAGTDTTNVPLTDLHGEIVAMAHLLDNMGMLVAEGLVRPELIAGYMGTSVVVVWEKLRSSIEWERQYRRELGLSDAYQAYFEHLAVIMREVDPDEARKKLRRWDESANPDWPGGSALTDLPLPGL